MKGRLHCREIVDAVLPPGPCLICGRDSRGGPAPGICRGCWKERRRPEPPLCAACGIPLPPGAAAGEGPVLCGGCLEDPPPYESHVSAYVYSGPVRLLVLLFKEEKRYPLAPLLGHAVVRCVRRAWPGEAFDLLVPVPSAWKRRLRRGFEPAPLIARTASRVLGVPLARALHLKRGVKLQKSLTAAQRRDNLRGAFRADAAGVSDRRILLLDDITTTGATLREAARVLCKAGASVRAVTVAMALKRDLDLG